MLNYKNNNNIYKDFQSDQHFSQRSCRSRFPNIEYFRSIYEDCPKTSEDPLVRSTIFLVHFNLSQISLDNGSLLSVLCFLKMTIQ